MPFRNFTMMAQSATWLTIVYVCTAVWLPAARAQQSAEQSANGMAGDAQSTTQQSAQLASTARHMNPMVLQRQPGQHPLVPLIRLTEAGLAHFDQNVRDYQCIFQKRERVDDELQDYQYIDLKVLRKPFSVYMKFRQPYPDREVLYVEGQNDDNLIALDSGMKRLLGKLTLDPEGMVAMRGQKYPITKVGIRNLMVEILETAKADSKFGECDVKTNANTRVDDRPTTMVEIIHPVPRQNFRYHRARFFFDHQLGVPIHYEAYLWPAKPGEKPPLDETYTYRQLRINTGLTPDFFDAENNPGIFQP